MPTTEELNSTELDVDVESNDGTVPTEIDTSTGKTLTQLSSTSANNNGATYGTGDVTRAATEDLMKENYADSTVARNSNISGASTLPVSQIT